MLKINSKFDTANANLVFVVFHIKGKVFNYGGVSKKKIISHIRVLAFCTHPFLANNKIVKKTNLVSANTPNLR